MRELEQAVRRILLTKHYKGDICDSALNKTDSCMQEIADGNLSALQVMASYCQMLYEKHGTYEEVAKITKLDRRTVKKHIMAAKQK